MNEITLEWQDGSQLRREVISQGQPSKNPGTVRLGRDPARCDIVLLHPTVSGLHVEIFFSLQQDCFKVRNLRGESNPPMIDGKLLPQGEISLLEGSTLCLGQLVLNVIEVSSEIAPTIILPPLGVVGSPSPNPVITPTVPSTYGLKCPNCGHISPFEKQNQPCDQCGHFLVNAESVLMPPSY